MDKDNKDRNPEYTDMRLAHRRTDIALAVISITLAAVFIGIGMYGIIWHFALPLLGVAQCQ